MFTILGKVLSTLSFGAAAALLALTPTASTTPVDQSQSAPVTAEQIGVTLHDEITSLRTQVEEAKFDAALPSDQLPVLGQQNDRVEQLQQILSSLGLLSSDSVTGYFGVTTTRAINYFQTYYGRPATGILDSATRDKLIQIAIDQENLSAVYFPEENSLLAIATSSEAMSNSSFDDTSYIPDDTSILDASAACPQPTVVTAPATTTAATTTKTTTATTTQTTSGKTTTTTATTTKTTTTTTTTATSTHH